jgi:transposase
MLTVDEIEQIRRAYYCAKQSVRAIAREQQHHRRVVREAIAGTAVPPRQYRQRGPRPRPMVDPVRPLIDAWLEADQDGPPKQRHTAKRVFDRLVAEEGYGGKERAIREYVHDWKQAHRSDVIGYLPLAYAPGAEGQCDWGEGLVRVAGVEHTAQLFLLRLAYSLKPFVCAFPTARQECFFAGHEAAFQLFGGVPHRITYDNLTTAVQKVLVGRNRTEQEAFVAFRGHHLFESFFCLPGKEGAHEKSLVETLVGYARRNFLVPIPDVPSWEALNGELLRRCVAEDERTVVGRAAPIGTQWEEERPLLLPLQQHPYPCCRTTPVRATRLGIVTFERNRYSVPSRFAGERLLLRAYPWHVEITDGRTVVARHPRLYGKGGEQLDPMHYLSVLERKPGAFEHARPIQQWAKRWPAIYQQYLDALRAARSDGATREFVRILQLHTRFPAETIATALERALALRCWSADGVEQLVRQEVAPSHASTAMDPAVLARLPEVDIPLPDLHCFDQLLSEVPA